MNQQLPTNSCASNDVQPEAVVLHEFENDLGIWPKKLDESMRSFWIEMGSSDCRHIDGDFKLIRGGGGQNTALYKIIIYS